MRAVHSWRVRLGRPRVAAGVLSVALLGGVACQAAPSGPVSVPLADAASARVYEINTNDDWTGHIPLTQGYTARLQLHLYTASGREVEPPRPLALSFTFSPSTLADASVADSALLLFDLTPSDSPGADGGMTIKLTEDSTETTKSFGPFYILVHSAQ